MPTIQNWSRREENTKRIKLRRNFKECESGCAKSLWLVHIWKHRCLDKNKAQEILDYHRISLSKFMWWSFVQIWKKTWINFLIKINDSTNTSVFHSRGTNSNTWKTSRNTHCYAGSRDIAWESGIREHLSFIEWRKRDTSRWFRGMYNR